MFASIEMIEKATTLNLNDVREALENNGYPDVDNEIIKVKYIGYNGKSFVYEITLRYNEDDDCRIFVSLERRNQENNYRFYGEY